MGGQTPLSPLEEWLKMNDENEKDEENGEAEDPDESQSEYFDESEMGIPIGDILTPVAATGTAPDGMVEPDSAPDQPAEEETKTIETASDAPSDDTPDIQAPPAGAPGIDLDAINGLKQQIEALIEGFETKIKIDEHKNKIIDTLHDELQTFREGIIKKHLYSFVTDVIKIIDDIRKFKGHYTGESPSEEVVTNLLTFLDSIASDLEDLFAWQGVVPFMCGTPTFESSRQRVIKKIDTDDPTKDKTVAESLRPGYEWDGKMIRPEMVAVYVYTQTSNGEDSAT